jgi:DNA-binding IscR family transcriptional regulator
MTLATNAVVLLAGSKRRRAPVAKLAEKLHASTGELRRAMRGLVRSGIVEMGGGQGAVACLPGHNSGLTLADVADATGDWLLTATCQEGRPSAYAGLDEALSLVRQSVHEGLARMRVEALARGAAADWRATLGQRRGGKQAARR